MKRMLLGLAALAFGTSTAFAATTGYISFEGDSYDLLPYDTRAVSLLIPEVGYDEAVVNRIAGKLDQAWITYIQLTGGRRPWPLERTTREGRATIAVVPPGETCGAGCGYLGFTGIEIARPFWDILYRGVRDRNEYDQVLFYELGRNFWFYDDQLGRLPSLATAYAVANRFVIMDAVDVDGGPFGTLDFEVFRRHVTVDQFAAYQADPTLDWSNTLAVGQGIPGYPIGDGPSFAGAILHRIYEDWGLAGYSGFIQSLNDQAIAITAEEAMANLLRAAYEGAGKDYSSEFKAAGIWSPPVDPGPTPVPLPPALPLLAVAVAPLTLMRRRSGP